MADLIAANEIIKAAVEEERAGKAYYATWAETSRNPKVKSEAARIAEMEKHHEEVFGQLLARLGEPAGAETYQGEYRDYLDALLGDRAFDCPEAGCALARRLSDVEALDLALKTEQKALLLYAFLEKQIPAKDRKLVEGVIEEERTHVVDLTRLKKELGA